MTSSQDPQHVLQYLARYTHRVAISHHRLVALKDGHVTFRYKDYQRGHRLRTQTLDAVEFLRRLMLHVPPHGFHRIRHFGFLANRVLQEKLAQCRTLLGHTTQPLARVETVDRAGARGASGCARSPVSSLSARAYAAGTDAVSTASGMGPVCSRAWT